MARAHCESVSLLIARFLVVFPGCPPTLRALSALVLRDGFSLACFCSCPLQMTFLISPQSSVERISPVVSRCPALIVARHVCPTISSSVFSFLVSLLRCVAICVLFLLSVNHWVPSKGERGQVYQLKSCCQATFPPGGRPTPRQYRGF